MKGRNECNLLICSCKLRVYVSSSITWHLDKGLPSCPYGAPRASLIHFSRNFARHLIPFVQILLSPLTHWTCFISHSLNWQEWTIWLCGFGLGSWRLVFASLGTHWRVAFFVEVFWWWYLWRDLLGWGWFGVAEWVSSELCDLGFQMGTWRYHEISSKNFSWDFSTISWDVARVLFCDVWFLFRRVEENAELAFMSRLCDEIHGAEVRAGGADFRLGRGS